jgi:hypothetical protein
MSRTAEDWRVWPLAGSKHQDCESCGWVLLLVKVSPRRRPEDDEMPADAELVWWESIRNPDAGRGEHTPERCRAVRRRR